MSINESYPSLYMLIAPWLILTSICNFCRFVYLSGWCVLGSVACGAAVCYHTYFDSKLPGHNPQNLPTDGILYMGYAVIPAHIIVISTLLFCAASVYIFG